MATSEALLNFWIKEVNGYARMQGMQVDPLPKVSIVNEEDVDGSDASNLLISTGGYIPATSQIILFTSNRHLKDIMRSYCHELVHHNQNLENHDYLMRVFSKPEDLVDNPQLEEIEGDAYLRGNLLFRKFTEWFKRQQKNNIS